jgi:hypothetical protein
MARDPEAAYFQTVEEFFVSRRGDPLFLSNADWLLVRKWRRAGVPLRVVLRGIADALDHHAHSFARARKVGSLAYCAAEVDAAVERWRRALAGDEGEEPTATLESLAELLESVPGLGKAGRAAADSVAEDLRAHALDARAEQSRILLAAEKKLVRALARDQGKTAVAKIQGEVERILAPYASRMPAKVLDQIREESFARRLLEAHGLPRLSLFHSPGAEDAGAA